MTSRSSCLRTLEVNNKCKCISLAALRFRMGIHSYILLSSIFDSFGGVSTSMVYLLTLSLVGELGEALEIRFAFFLHPLLQPLQ